MRIGGQATPPATAASSEAGPDSRLLAWQRSLALIVSAGPVLVVGVAVLSVIIGATPAALAVATGRLIDALHRAVRAGTWAGLSGPLILVGSLAVAREVALSAQ